MDIPKDWGHSGNTVTETDYELRKMTDYMAVLHSLDGSSQVLTWKENLNLFYEKVPNRKSDRSYSLKRRENKMVAHIGTSNQSK